MTVAGVILAAGSSTRMGRPKQLLPVRGRPLLELVVDAACTSRLDPVVVVLGAGAGRIRAGVRWGRASIVLNRRHAEGISSSLRTGTAALGAGVEAAVVILGDQPGVSAPLLDRLLELWAGSGRPLAAMSRAGLLQPPALLAREMWGEVRALRGDTGLRALLRSRPELVAALEAGPDAGVLADVDTPDDWRQAQP